MTVCSISRRVISLMPLHSGQVNAYWAWRPHRFKALRCGRRFGKTDFAKIWIAQGLLQGEECAWFTPQHMTWSEVYPDLVQMLRPLVDKAQRPQPPYGCQMVAVSTFGRWKTGSLGEAADIGAS
jgi:hypothetical protein